MVTKGLVLGHIISKEGMQVDRAKVAVVEQLPTPKTVRDIRSFLGHAGFYRRFIKKFSAISTTTLFSFDSQQILNSHGHNECHDILLIH